MQWCLQDNQVGVQSMKMLKIRAALEENLRQRGLFSSIPSKPEKVEKKMKSVNGYSFSCFIIYTAFFLTV